MKAIKDWFLDQLVLKYDRVLVITVSSTRSPVFENATKASFMILSGYKERRKAAGLEEQFALRVLDSKTLFTGQGVVVYEALRLLQGGQAEVAFDRLRQHVESFSQDVHAYLVPQDLFYVRARAHQKGDKSVGWFKYQMGTMLDIKPILKAYRGETEAVETVRGFDGAMKKLFQMAGEAVEKGLLTKVVCMSYAGNPEDVKSFPGLRRVREGRPGQQGGDPAVGHEHRGGYPRGTRRLQSGLRRQVIGFIRLIKQRPQIAAFVVSGCVTVQSFLSLQQ